MEGCPLRRRHALIWPSLGAPRFSVAEALEWIMRQNGVTKVDRYLDDFITMGPPNSEACSTNLHQIRAVCEDLGVPLAMDKLDGPTQCLTFLGIEIDTQAGILRLSADKLSRLKAQLMGRSVRKSCRRYQLEALIGTLQRACRVVRPGRAFLGRTIDLLRIQGATQRYHHIRLGVVLSS